ncbi:MAG: hypothetical protein LBR10_12690 [Prevotellaceae bacterium]|jgi:hypothetical protein|nr:hypothetical protein [Prevotellaceae bacterium]
MKILEKDSIIFGLTVSIAVPLALFLTAYLVKFHSFGFHDTWVTKVFSICVFPNGLIFYFYIVKNKLRTMRGMLAGTFLMALVMLILFAIVRNY